MPVFIVRISVNKKVLRIVSGNADSSHSFVKLLLCGRHGKPYAARFACFKTAAAVNQNCKLFRLVPLPYVLRWLCRDGCCLFSGRLFPFLALNRVAR